MPPNPNKQSSKSFNSNCSEYPPNPYTTKRESRLKANQTPAKLVKPSYWNPHKSRMVPLSSPIPMNHAPSNLHIIHTYRKRMLYIYVNMYTEPYSKYQGSVNPGPISSGSPRRLLPLPKWRIPRLSSRGPAWRFIPWGLINRYNYDKLLIVFLL